ncbi:long-chain acyl-CoA synthetase [Ereboglobus sp. PH5-10]|nr:long-chain acyl-CoA synthetase [Ereboglobus sp. PH5-10]
MAPVGDTKGRAKPPAEPELSPNAKKQSAQPEASPYLTSLLATWRALVAQSPTATAVIDGDTARVWTRAELAAAARAWLDSLPADARAHITRRRVVMAEPNSARWFYIFLGLLEIGAVPALADSKETPDRLAAIADASRAAAILRDGELTLLAPRPPVRRRDELLIKLTSGSTGVPKALVFTHAQMLADGRQICATMRIGPGDLNLGIIPFGHSYGLGHLVIPLLEQGTPLLSAASPFPQSIAADCARWKPTVFPAVPTLLRALSNTDVSPVALASLRLVISAGAPLQPADALAFANKYGKHVHNFYGTSETGGIAYDRNGDAAETGRAIGQLIDGVRITFRRGKRFTVESPSVHGRGRYSPPDRGEFNPAGELTLLGRAGRTLKIAGRRLDPGEVETMLRALTGVREAFVAAHPTRPDAIAAAVATDAPLPTAADIRRQLTPRLAAWKIPDRIVVLPAFPLTQRGKTDRAALIKLIAK